MTRRASALFAALLLALFLGGCAGLDLAPGERFPTDPAATAGELAPRAAAPWPARFRVRVSAALDLGRPLPWTGIVEADRAAGTVRAVGVADTGLTLFDFAAAPDGTTVHRLIEPLGRVPRLPERLGAALARIFVDPFPKADDILEIVPEFYRLHREGPEGRTTFALAGDGRLLSKSLSGEAGSWSVRCRDPGVPGGPSFPARIEYREGGVFGLGLTLRVEELRDVGDGH